LIIISDIWFIKFLHDFILPVINAFIMVVEISSYNLDELILLKKGVVNAQENYFVSGSLGRK